MSETTETKLPRRVAAKWPLLMEAWAGDFGEHVNMQAWKVVSCQSRGGAYAVRLVPAGAVRVDAVRRPVTQEPAR